MSRFLRKLRGGIGTALTWGIAWAIPGALIGAGLAGFGGLMSDLGEITFLFATISLGAGVVAGGVFSLLLATVHRDRRLEELGAGTMAVWGAGAALSVPILAIGAASFSVGLFSAVWMMVLAVYIGLAGAFTAGGIIRIAQKASAPGSDASDLLKPSAGD